MKQIIKTGLAAAMLISATAVPTYAGGSCSCKAKLVGGGYVTGVVLSIKAAQAFRKKDRGHRWSQKYVARFELPKRCLVVLNDRLCLGGEKGADRACL